LDEANIGKRRARFGETLSTDEIVDPLINHVPGHFQLSKPNYVFSVFKLI
jgi:hypothetical protein